MKKILQAKRKGKMWSGSTWRITYAHEGKWGIRVPSLAEPVFVYSELFLEGGGGVLSHHWNPNESRERKVYLTCPDSRSKKKCRTYKMCVMVDGIGVNVSGCEWAYFLIILFFFDWTRRQTTTMMMITTPKTATPVRTPIVSLDDIGKPSTIYIYIYIYLKKKEDCFNYRHPYMNKSF